MSEVTFAKTFLATLDKRPVKLPADAIADPRSYASQSPSILPRLSHPFPKKPSASTLTASPDAALTIHLKPLRAAPPIRALTLPARTRTTTTVLDLKTSFADANALRLDRVKILFNKKPAHDLKTLADLGVPPDAAELELSVMVMGGAGGGGGGTAAAAAETMDVDPGPESERAHAEAVAEGKREGSASSAREILQTDGFWEDLEGFLGQRLRDEGEGKRVVGVFRDAMGRTG